MITAQISYIKKLNSLVLLQQTFFTLSWLVSLALLGMKLNLVHASPQTWGYLFLAYFSARTSGMCFNRLIDKDIDSKNPRTCNRALPKNQISESFTLVQALFFLGLMYFSAMQCNTTVFLLSILLALLLVGYSFTKRFTWLCHFALGSIYLVALITFWAAIADTHFQIPLLLGLSLACLIAASDILYAVADFDFDRVNGIQSIPARFGIEKAETVAKLFHGASVLFLLVLSSSISLSIVASSVGVGIGIVFSYYKFDFDERFRFINTYSGTFFLFGCIWHVL